MKTRVIKKVLSAEPWRHRPATRRAANAITEQALWGAIVGTGKDLDRCKQAFRALIPYPVSRGVPNL